MDHLVVGGWLSAGARLTASPIEIVEQSGLLGDLHASEAQLHEDAEVAALRAELDALRAEAKARLAEVIEKERRQYRSDLKADIALLREAVQQ